MDSYSKRKYIIGSIFILVGLIFIIKLFNLQVISVDYKQYATKNILRPEIIYPARGLIYDRKGELLVQNKAAYDLLVTPREVKAFDTAEFCAILDIKKEHIIDALKKAKDYSPYRPSPIVKQIPPEIYAPFQEKLYKYPGFFVQTRTLREYPRKTAGSVLGSVGEVNDHDIAKDNYYKSGDYIGSKGLEQSYEKYLRGKKGIKYHLVDVHNRIKGSYNNGKMDTVAVLGNNLVCTLDADLQEYAELLLQNKKGSVVAIEPSTGEVLVCATAPTYDPNLLVGRKRGENYSKLASDTLLPLFNRAISASYSPGSTFKSINTLIALQEGVITPNTKFYCAGEIARPIKCTHFHEPNVNAHIGMRESCNPYFWNVFKSIVNKNPDPQAGFDNWSRHVKSFGLGQKLNSELGGLSPGLVPDSAYYNSRFKFKWNASTVRSLAIGQGELSTTPFQMANMVAAIANKGFYIEPHFIRSIQEGENEYQNMEFEIKQTTIDTTHFVVLYDGMQAAVEETSTQYKTKVRGIDICGKTGTIENNTDIEHSAFIAFAPRKNPQIAISVYVENGKWGMRYAAPIASLIIEKYINGEISGRYRKQIETEMIEKNLLNILNEEEQKTEE